MEQSIRDKVARFPKEPGVYLFRGDDGKVLYAGKAADLRARVRNYLTPGGDGRYQLRFLEREARDVESVSYTHSPSPRDLSTSRMPSSA